MTPREAAPRVLLFLAIVIGFAIVPPLLVVPEEPTPTDRAGQSYEVFQPGRILATASEADGRVQLGERAPESKLILIDTEHGNRFSDAGIQPLVTALTDRGHTVRYFDTSTARPGGLPVALEDADAYVVINPTDQHTVREADAVEAFVQDGGRLLLVGRPTDTGPGIFGTRSSGIEDGHANLAARFGISFGGGYLYNMQRNVNNFQSIYASPRVSDPLTGDVERVVLREATPVQVSRGTILLRAAPGTRLSSTRDRGQYPVMVRRGDVTAIGDGTVFAPENVPVADNEALVGNIGTFLVSGTIEEEPEAPTETPIPDEPADPTGTETPTPG